jgi:hypothetical protein
VSKLHGRPTAQELTEAVREFLESQVLADGAPAGAFQVRVAVNALKVVERELATGGQDVLRHRERLAALGFRDDAALARALRRGEVPAERLPAVRAAVLASVEDKLRVANPKHLTEN